MSATHDDAPGLVAVTDMPTTTDPTELSAVATEHPSLLPTGEGYLLLERTFIFLDLTGFTEFTRDRGPVKAADLLAEFRRATRTVASQLGVRVANWMGDGAMLVGVEPAPSIALGAHLIDQFRYAGPHVRVGIATGEALLFEGDDYIGDSVNLASRLCTAAGPGEILAACDPGELTYWVRVCGTEQLSLRGLGEVSGVLRLQPRLAA